MIKLKSGFTLVELIISIVVIGILAAIITILMQGGLKNRAYDVAVQQDLKSSYDIVYRQIIRGTAMPKTSAELESFGLQPSIDAYATDHLYNYVYCPPFPYSKSNRFAFIGTSRSGKTFMYSDGKMSEYTGNNNGNYTMEDYADICIAATDKNDEFYKAPYNGDFNGADVWVTCAGYSANITSTDKPKWRKWAGGTFTSSC